MKNFDPFLEVFGPQAAGYVGNLIVDGIDWVRHKTAESFYRSQHRTLNSRYKSGSLPYSTYIQGVRHYQRQYSRFERNFRSAHNFFAYGNSGPFKGFAYNLLSWRRRQKRRRRRA